MGRGGRGVWLVAVLLGGAACAGSDGRTLAAARHEAAASTSTTAERPAPRCTPLPEAETAEEVAVVAGWQAGDARDFTVIRRRTNSADPSLDGASYETDVRVGVTEVTPAGATMRWSQSGEGVFRSGVGSAVADRGAGLFEEIGDMVVDYTLDEEGQFEGVTNRAAIRGYLDRMVTLLKGLMSSGEYAEDEGFDRADFDRLWETMEPLLLSDQFIDTALVQYIATFHDVYGIVLPRYGTVQFDEELPNPLGGAPVAVDGSVEVLTDRDANGCTVIRHVVVPKPGALATAMESMADIVGSDAAARDQIRRSMGDMALRQEIRHVHDPGTGWPVRVEVTKIIESDGQVRTDVFVLEAK